MGDDVRLGPPVVSIDVPTCEVQRALRSVIPHAATDRDSPEPYLRIHWRYDPITGHLYVGGTNGMTVGLAAVSIADDRIAVDTSKRWTTTVDVAKQIRRQFATKDEGSEEGFSDFLRVDVHAEWMVVTDVSGMFAGEQARWRQSSDALDSVNLVRVMRAALGSVAAGREMLFTPAEQTITSGRWLALFRDATIAYEEPLVLRHAVTSDRPVILIACGDSFLGLVRPQPTTVEDRAQIAEWEQGWVARLAVDIDVPREDAAPVQAPAGAR